MCTVSQYPTQAVKMVFGDGASQLTYQSLDLNCLRAELTGGISDRAEANHTHRVNKRAKLSDSDVRKSTLPSMKSPINPICEINTKENCRIEKVVEVSFAMPDVAAAIDDLLEETSKIPDQKSPGRTGCVKSIQDEDKAPPPCESLIDYQTVPFVCKREHTEDHLTNNEAGPYPVNLFEPKRAKQSDPSSSHQNGSEDSTTTSHEPTAGPMNLALMEFPLLETFENETSPQPVNLHI